MRARNDHAIRKIAGSKTTTNYTMIEKRTISRQQSIQLTALPRVSKIAYFLLVHRYPQQFKRLFRAIYNKDNHYLIHIDKKADPDVLQKVRYFLKAYPNAHIMESIHVLWGGYSMVQSELNGMKYLLTNNLSWDYYINLSGQDFPLRSQEFILDFLSRNKNKNFIETANQVIDRPDTMNRVENYFTETDTGFTGVPYKRPFMENVTPYIGGQWMILTRSCCEFICHSPEVREFENFYRNTLIADESFFQTVLMNSSFNEVIVNDDKRAIIWIPDGDIKLRPKTLTVTDLDYLMEGNNLFARKFDEEVDGAILDILENSLEATVLVNSSNRSNVSPIKIPETKQS